MPVRREGRCHPKAEGPPRGCRSGVGGVETGSPSRLSFNEQTHKDLEAINPELGLQNQTRLQLPLGMGEREEEDGHKASQGAQALCPLLPPPLAAGLPAEQPRCFKGARSGCSGQNRGPKKLAALVLLGCQSPCPRDAVRIGRSQGEQPSLALLGAAGGAEGAG